MVGRRGPASFVSARQPGEQPVLVGGHGDQDLPDLFQRPVVGQLADGHTTQFYRGRLCPKVYQLHKRYRLGWRVPHEG